MENLLLKHSVKTKHLSQTAQLTCCMFKPPQVKISQL